MKLTPVDFDPFAQEQGPRLVPVNGNPFAKKQAQLDPMEGIGHGQRFLEGAGKAFVDVGRGIGQIFGAIPQSEIDEAKRIDAPLMDTGAGIAGNIGANLLTAVIPGGSTVRGSALIGAGLSALQPTSADESRFKNTMIGGALGAGGAGAAKMIGKGQSAAASKVAALEDAIRAKAAEAAAAETASARSAAGNAAQNAYRQLEHLRELNAVRGLTPQEAQIAKELTEELALKAQEKLIPAAAMKKATAEAYQEAVATEAERAAKLAAEKLSPTEAKNQLMARLKRYGPAAVGGAIAGEMLIPGFNAIGGAATGLVLRPAIRSMRNLSKNPAVQHQMLSPVAGSGLLGHLSDPRYLGLFGPAIYAAQE